MLVLSRKAGERIVIGGNIVITVVDMGHGRVRLGIDAPSDVRILREELRGKPLAAPRGPDENDRDLADKPAEWRVPAPSHVVPALS